MWLEDDYSKQEQESRKVLLSYFKVAKSQGLKTQLKHKLYINDKQVTEKQIEETGNNVLNCASMKTTASILSPESCTTPQNKKSNQPKKTKNKKPSLHQSLIADFINPASTSSKDEAGGTKKWLEPQPATNNKQWILIWNCQGYSNFDPMWKLGSKYPDCRWNLKNFYVFIPPAIKEKSKGKASGGLIIFIKNQCNVKVVENSNLWLIIEITCTNQRFILAIILLNVYYYLNHELT